jgi:hypothetical protein
MAKSKKKLPVLKGHVGFAKLEKRFEVPKSKGGQGLKPENAAKLARYVGIKKYGKNKFQQMATSGRSKKKNKRRP